MPYILKRATCIRRVCCIALHRAKPRSPTFVTPAEPTLVGRIKKALIALTFLGVACRAANAEKPIWLAVVLDVVKNLRSYNFSRRSEPQSTGSRSCRHSSAPCVWLTCCEATVGYCWCHRCWHTSEAKVPDSKAEAIRAVTKGG